MTGRAGAVAADPRPWPVNVGPGQEEGNRQGYGGAAKPLEPRSIVIGISRPADEGDTRREYGEQQSKQERCQELSRCRDSGVCPAGKLCAEVDGQWSGPEHQELAPAQHLNLCLPRSPEPAAPEGALLVELLPGLVRRWPDVPKWTSPGHPSGAVHPAAWAEPERPERP